MKQTIAAFLMLIATLGSCVITTHAQSATFKCYEVNYGEGAGWQKVNFKIILDAGNYRLHVYDPKLELHIKLIANGLQRDDTYQWQGVDQSGIKCNVYSKTSEPQMISVQYYNKFFQHYKIKE